MISKLSILLEEPWRDSALKYDVIDRYSTGAKRTSPPVKFNSPLVDDLLRIYVIAPSKMRKKILQEIAVSINTSFNLIRDNNFLKYQFLSDDDEFESTLKHRCLRNRNSYDTILEYTTNAFFELIKNDKLIDALAYINNSNFGFLLFPQDDDDDDKTIEYSSSQSHDDYKMKRLASIVYLYQCRKWRVNYDGCAFGPAFIASKVCFCTAKDTIIELKNWLNTKHPNSEKSYNAGKAYSIVYNSYEENSNLDLLFEKDFQGLYDISNINFLN